MEPREGAPPAFRERNAEELARLATLVRSAVGFSEQRGDRVEVVSMRFAEPMEMPVRETGPFGIALTEALVARLFETALIGLLALLTLLFVARPVARRLSLALAPPAALAAAGGAAGELPGGAAAGGAALPPGEQAALLAGETMIDVAQIQGQMRASSIARVVTLVEQNPEETLLVLRRWLTPEDDL
jgi:flagellar M-ring protein FliF